MKIVKRAWLLVLICTICFTACGKKKQEPVSKTMYCDFINVGKGDAILIRNSGKTIMIDTGYEETADTVNGFLEKEKVNKIDILILSHFDKDHIGGAISVLKKFDVRKIYMPDYEDEGNKYKDFIEYLKEKNHEKLAAKVTKRMEFKLGNLEVMIDPCKEKEYKSENNYSLVTKITNDEDTYLFAGDAKKKRINELLDEDFIMADVMKIPHHGRLDDNSVTFIDRVRPWFAVCTVASESDVDQVIKDELNSIDATYYFTCNGNVSCVSDGERNYKFSVE